MDIIRLIHNAIARRQADTDHAMLWHFDNIGSEENVANTQELFATFSYNDKDGVFTILGNTWAFGVRMESDTSGWVVLKPVLSKTHRAGASVELQQTRRSLEEIKAWWRENNPHMQRE